MDPIRTTFSTPASSPGLFSPITNSEQQPLPSQSLSDGTPQSSPYLHPLQMHRVRETHKAQVEQDFITGRKLINQYEIINEIGRGVHGKVKLARSLETGDFVAIKIIQRFSKKRKLGRVTVSPEGKTKREIAILKKVRHANVVGLLEVIDDPEFKKIYVILEHVELGEIVWRRKGAAHICLYEQRRIEKEQSTGDREYCDDEKYLKMIERRRLRKTAQRVDASQLQLETNPSYWSLEHGNDDDDDNMSTFSRENVNSSQVFPSRDPWLLSNPDSQVSSRTSSRAASARISRAHTPFPAEVDIPTIDSDNDFPENSSLVPFPSLEYTHGSFPALDRLYCGNYVDSKPYRCRSPSMVDSIISHMSSIDDAPLDALEEDFSYVPCFTIDQARSAFRDTVLGLEYLHYEGIVHRDIKPANLLWTKDHRVKISDFGVSYFGRPIRDDETEENVSEADATDFDDDLELAKTVGTPAFFAPELCCTDLDTEQPKVTEQIDIWSLGITLYCLIYARIPFLANDEWQLFRCIAQDEVYIPRRRLKAVNQKCNVLPGDMRRSMSSNSSYREENELAFEFVDDELYDLLKRMLIKDPAQRIKLREVKRHPWLLRGLNDIIGWLDETDPSRVTSGRRIEVNKHELERAVVPLTFLERARTAVKKAVGKVIGVARSDTRSDRSRGSRRPRRRAQSSATSSGTDTHINTPITPIVKSSRRSSFRGDEFYSSGLSADTPGHQCESNEYSSAQSSISRPNESQETGDLPTSQSRLTASSAITPIDTDVRVNVPDRMSTTFTPKKVLRHRGHSYSRSVNTSSLISFGDEPRTPILKNLGNFFDIWHGPRGRESLPDIKESSFSRAHSVDRSFFDSEDKHAEASVAVTVATVPGKFQQPFRHHSRSASENTDTCTGKESHVSSFSGQQQGLGPHDISEPTSYYLHAAVDPVTGVRLT